jgi:hypothetical protein
LLDHFIEDIENKHQWYKNAYEFVENTVKPKWTPLLDQQIIHEHFELLINEDIPIKYSVEYYSVPSLTSPDEIEKIKGSWEIVGIDSNYKYKCCIKYIKALMENDIKNMSRNKTKIFHGHLKYHEFERVAYGNNIYKKNGEVFNVTQED